MRENTWFVGHVAPSVLLEARTLARPAEGEGAVLDALRRRDK